MTLRVTALVVTYQHAAYIEEALRSALEQSEPPNEIVVVDDGSTDGTLDRVRAMSSPQLRIVALPHRGIASLAATYNEGLGAATGDLVSLLEGDDRWLPDRLERHRCAFADPQVTLAHAPYAVIGAHGRPLRSCVAPPVYLPEGRYDAFARHLLMSYIMLATTTIRRSSLERVGGFAQLGATPHIDYPTYLRLSEEGFFHYDPRPNAEWRKHASSGTSRLAGTDLSGAALCRDFALAAHARSSRRDLPSPADIRLAWEDAQGRQIWNGARILLRQRRYDDARTVLALAADGRYRGTLRARLKLAWVAARLHLDLEGAIAIVRGRSVFEELE